MPGLDSPIIQPVAQHYTTSEENKFGLYKRKVFVTVIKSRRMVVAEHATRLGTMGNAHIPLVGRPDMKTPRGRPGRKWEDIKYVG